MKPVTFTIELLKSMPRPAEYLDELRAIATAITDTTMTFDADSEGYQKLRAKYSPHLVDRKPVMTQPIPPQIAQISIVPPIPKMVVPPKNFVYPAAAPACSRAVPTNPILRPSPPKIPPLKPATPFANPPVNPGNVTLRTLTVADIEVLGAADLEEFAFLKPVLTEVARARCSGCAKNAKLRPHAEHVAALLLGMQDKSKLEKVGGILKCNKLHLITKEGDRAIRKEVTFIA